MNMYKSIGFVFGLIIGLIFVVILFKYANQNHKAKTEYDERQAKIRGKAYQYSFYTLIVCEVIASVIDMMGIQLPMESYMIHIAAIFCGCLTLGGYTIWNDGYWGLNNNRKRYLLVIIFAVLLNFIPIIGALYSGTMIENGKLNTPFLNVMVVIMLAVIGIIYLIKHLADKASEETED